MFKFQNPGKSNKFKYLKRIYLKLVFFEFFYLKETILKKYNIGKQTNHVYLDSIKNFKM